MAMFSATTVVVAPAARLPSRPQLRVARADTLRCNYSKEALKACSAMNLSPEVLKGLGLRRVSRPWGSKLVEERIDTEAMGVGAGRGAGRLLRLSRALNPEWVLACVLGYIFFNPRRLRRIYDDQKTSGLTL